MENKHDISIHELEQIEAYLAQTMPAAEYEAFEDRLNREPLLQQKLDEVSQLISGVKEATLQNKLNDFHAKIPGQKGKLVRADDRFSKRYWLVAASVIVLLAAGLLLMLGGESKSEKLFTKYFEADAGLVTAMGSTENYVFERGMVDYKTRNYKAALETWKPLLVTKPDNDTLNYFFGMAQLASNNTVQSISSLTKTASQQQSFFYSDACWYLALALLRENKIQEAIPYLEKANHPQKDELLSILKK